MNKWTFGIVTGGDDLSKITKVLQSIGNLKIPTQDFEIVIVGPRFGEVQFPKRIVNFVEFDESIKKAWITRKKNIIAEEAKFDNIVMMHDYITLDSNWYQGWEEFNDWDWDCCMNPIYNKNGDRFRDWVLFPPRKLEYNDTSRLSDMYISGGYWCVKKSYMLANPLDEELVWGEGEDVEWSKRLRDTWNYKCNHYSSVRFLKQKHPHWAQ